MSEDRLDLSLFETGEQELPEAAEYSADVHTKKTLPVSMSGYLTAESLGIQDEIDAYRNRKSASESSDDTTPREKKHLGTMTRSEPGLHPSTSREVVLTGIETDATTMWSVGVERAEVKAVAWQRKNMLHFVDASKTEYLVELADLQATAIRTSPSRSLIGFDHGELYCLDHETQTMTCLYTQVHGQSISAIYYYEAHQSCFFVTVLGTVYICRSIDDGNRVRRLKQQIHPNTRLFLLDVTTQEFIWFAADGGVYSSDLRGAAREVLRLDGEPRHAVFSSDGSLLYILDQNHVLSIYSWVGDNRCLYQKPIQGEVVDLFVDHQNNAYGVFVEQGRLSTDRLS